MIKILFICHGNICRSPMAEFVMKDLVAKEKLEDKFCIESAATSAEEIGNGIYPQAREQLVKHNISGHKNKTARQIEKSDYDEFDYLIIMDQENEHSLRRIFREDGDNKIHKLLEFAEDDKIKGADIDDPWYTREFGLCFDEIESGCKGLLDYLKSI